MSKLSTVVKSLELLKGLPEEINLPLSWPKKRLLARLERCVAIDVVEWHEHKLPWIEKTNNQSLRKLCQNVTTALCAADYKVKLLAHFVRGNRSLPFQLTHRLILLWALVDIQDAFKIFEEVRRDLAFEPYHIREMVLRYLGRVYELMLLLGQLLYPLGSDVFWFSESWEYLQKSGLRDFIFDVPEDYLPAKDPTLAGVLAHSAEVPESYLPANPGPPVYYRNEGPYGPTILRNYVSSFQGEWLQRARF